MKLLKKTSSVLLGGLILTLALTAYSSNSTNTSEENTKVEKAKQEEVKPEVKYDTVMDEKFKKTEQREIRVTTDSTDEKDLRSL